MGAGSPSRDELDDVKTPGQAYPAPLLMLSSQVDQRLVAEASDTAIEAYVTEGLSPGLVRSLVDVAVRQFQQVKSLWAE